MGLSVFPEPSTASAPYPTAGTVVVSTTVKSSWYSTTLAAGTYVVTVMGQTSLYNTLSNYESFAVSAYESNIQSVHNIPGSPTVIKLTTSETVYFSITQPLPGANTWQYYFGNLGNDIYGLRHWSLKNCDFTSKPVIVLGTQFNNIYAAPAPITTGAASIQPQSTNSWARHSVSGTVRGSYESTPNVYVQTPTHYYATFPDSSWYASTDGITWTTLTTPGGIVMDICFASFNNYYVAVSAGTTTTTNISSSTNGSTWTTRTGAIAAAMYSVVAGPNLFVAVGSAGSIQTSTDSITWSSRTSPQTGADWTTVAYNTGSGTYYAIAAAVSNGITAAYSTNGITWTGIAPVMSKASEGLLTTFNGVNMTLAVSPLVPNGTNRGWKYSLFTGGGNFFLNYDAMTYVSTNGLKWNLIYNRDSSGSFWHPTNGLMGYRQAGSVWYWYYPSDNTFVIYNSTAQ